MNPLAHVPITTAEAIDLLRTTLLGKVLTAADAGDETNHLSLPAPGRPLAIVLATGTDDIVQAIRFARAEQLPVAVRSRGQRAAGAVDGAVLIDVGALDHVTVDADSHTATVGAGATWGEVVAAARPHGLAPVLGEWSQRSAVSDTLAGGMGWLARRYGLASDSVICFELVTPDGLVVAVSADTHPELYWALSGAGDGSLGVVAAIELELHPITRVYAGSLRYPPGLAGEVLARWRTWITGTRPELTASVVVAADGVAVHGCWSGAIESGRRLVDDWRAWRIPDADDWRERALTDLDLVGDARLAPPAVTLPAATAPAATATAGSATMTNEWANALRDELFDELRAIVADDAGAAVVEVRLVGGAARSRSGSAANGRGRSDQFLITLAGIGGRSDAVRQRLAPFVTGAVHLDRTDSAERSRRTHAAFGREQWDRLCAVKAALDPANRFRLGLAIEPQP